MSQVLADEGQAVCAGQIVGDRQNIVAVKIRRSVVQRGIGGVVYASKGHIGNDVQRVELGVAVGCSSSSIPQVPLK